MKKKLNQKFHELQISKEMDAFGRQDLSMLLDENKPQEKPLYLYETDKVLEQELKGVANGY